MCLYQFENGSQCQLEDEGKGFCFWHDPTIDKTDMPLAQALESVIRSGHCMEGAALAYANLNELNLVSHDKSKQFSLARADLYHCHLNHAHLFNVNFTQASLMKADCRNSNLHFANLTQANLLGAKFDDAKIENINWGEKIYHECLAEDALAKGKTDDANRYFEQAEEVCRHVRKVSEHQGLFELAGMFFIKEMTMRRFQLPKFSLHRLTSKAVDVFCGYGEKPLRVISFSLFLIVLFALVYWLLGIQDSQDLIQFSSNKNIYDNLIALSNALYFSVVTFTTLGYGDLTPIGISRLFAALEAFLGSFTIALFVVVFVKKMTR